MFFLIHNKCINIQNHNFDLFEFIIFFVLRDCVKSV